MGKQKSTIENVIQTTVTMFCYQQAVSRSWGLGTTHDSVAKLAEAVWCIADELAATQEGAEHWEGI